MGTVIVGAIIICIVALIVRGIIVDRKMGKTICGSNCKDCGGSCSR